MAPPKCSFNRCQQNTYPLPDQRAPYTLKCNERFRQVTPVYEPPRETETTVPSVIPALPVASKTLHSSSVQVDPDNILPQETQLKFQSLLKSYDTVFDPNIKGYNGAAGPFEAKVNMGPVELPQRKGCPPKTPVES